MKGPWMLRAYHLSPGCVDVITMRGTREEVRLYADVLRDAGPFWIPVIYRPSWTWRLDRLEVLNRFRWSSEGGTKGMCSRWQIARGRPCVCGHHEEEDSDGAATTPP